MEGLSLHGEWRLTSDDGLELPAVLPGDNISALLRAGRIPDPYYAKNELLVQEVLRHEWKFSRSFFVPNELLGRRHVYLCVSMADTFFVCFINGRRAGEGTNQFEAYRWDVKPFLKAGENTIVFSFEAPEKQIALRKAKLYGEVPYQRNGLEDWNLIRKTACHGGWDWGITLVPCGIYDDIRLVPCDVARLDYLYAEQEHHRDGAVTVTVIAEVFAEDAGEVTVDFTFDGQSVRKRKFLPAGRSQVKAEFEVKQPRLWWPSGYGEQPLYHLTAQVDGQEKSCEIGLRKIELIHEKDEFGVSMAFRVNGVEVFAKGANWIPCDAMPGAQTLERYENLLESARLANMNMVRVWGGGQYEREVFYSICDRKGLMVWQDMMFACSQYPTEEWFQREVDSEVRHQVKRLRSHPCIVLWCGDNECMGSAHWHGADKVAECLRLFAENNRVVQRAVEESDSERVFWPTSPCGGPGSIDDGWGKPSQGDMHYWEVWHGHQPFEAYFSVHPRFCSEFGYESYPSMELIRKFCPPEQRNIFSPVMEHRQKCAKGNAPILAMFERYFWFPEGLANFVYLSQLQQALAIKMGVEYWRTTRPCCMGTLFWQLNDDWPTISWSSVEHGGKWKQLMYHAKRFYQPVFSTLLRLPGEAPRLFTVNDLRESVEVCLRVTAWNLNGRKIGMQEFAFSMRAGESRMVTEYDETGLVVDVPAEELLWEIRMEARTEDGHRFQARNTAFSCPYKELRLEQAVVQAEFRDGSDGVEVTLRTDKPALYVTLDTTGVQGIFDDNSFCLLPDEPRLLVFHGDANAETLEKSTTITHLRMIY